ncbi:hypothetical protein NW825_15055 [Brevibacillus laterosporus]|nr:hypothetical protein [Brevibacillus laterosporus]
MFKRTRTSKVEKWIKEGRGFGIGADYKLWLDIQDVSSLGRSTRLKGIKTNKQHEPLLAEWDEQKCHVARLCKFRWSREN